MAFSLKSIVRRPSGLTKYSFTWLRPLKCVRWARVPHAVDAYLPLWVHCKCLTNIKFTLTPVTFFSSKWVTSLGNTRPFPERSWQRRREVFTNSQPGGAVMTAPCRAWEDVGSKMKKSNVRKTHFENWRRWVDDAVPVHVSRPKRSMLERSSSLTQHEG